MSEPCFCDNCGCKVYESTRCLVESLPCNIASANEGESATLCPDCFPSLESPR